MLSLALLILTGCEERPAPTPARAAEAARVDVTPEVAVDDRAATAEPATTAAVDASPPSPAASRASVSRVDDMATFIALSEGFGTERYLKIFVDARDGEVVFFDTNLFPLHVDAAAALFHGGVMTPEDFARFEKNYTPDRPDFLMAVITQHRDQEMWSFSFWEGDQLEAVDVLRVYQALEGRFFRAEALRFLPTSSAHEELAAAFDSALPVITHDALYRGRRYLAFTEGRAVGRLRVIRSEADLEQAQPDEVLLLTLPVPDLRPARGVINETPISPLSHVAIRARAWDIPHASLKGAAARFESLEGTPVYLEVTPRRLTLRPATDSERDVKQDAPPTPRAPVLAPVDLSRRELASLSSLRREDAPAYGAKAANLGAVAAIETDLFEVPEGFAIPVWRYHDHLRRSGLDASLIEVIAAARGSEGVVALEGLRAAIRSAPVDPALLDEVMARVAALGLLEDGGGIFVRSSTTAEDLPDFSGAGLYDTVPNVRARDDIARAILQVWASVWNLRAFHERERFAIDHVSVLAAILIQRGMDASAAGVMVTANLFDEDDARRFTITANRGLGLRVVEGRRVPEQLLYDPYEGSIQVISRSNDPTTLLLAPEGGVQEVSNPDAGQPVLSDAMIKHLGDTGERIYEAFNKGVEREDAVDLDVEWLFIGERLFIVQARPLVD